jgi:hypothetical protein
VVLSKIENPDPCPQSTASFVQASNAFAFVSAAW